MLRSIAELAAYGAFAVLLTAASFSPAGDLASSATTADATPPASVTAPNAERGALLFSVKGCIGCHMHPAVPGARMQIGPDLSGLAVRAGARVAGLDAVGYIRQSLRDPGRTAPAAAPS